jgi:phosphotriesterase-related protein
MNRRSFVRSLCAASAVLATSGCGSRFPSASSAAPGVARAQVMTVKGAIDAADMGVTLAHEHLFADLRAYAEQQQAISIDEDEVVDVVLPHLRRIVELGCRTLVDCTATHLGRHPRLIRRLSDASGLHMLTVTGNYLSADRRFMPPYVEEDSTESLAQRWIDEWEHGIDGTGIRPGLIKLGVEGGPLPAIEEKLLRAAILAHRESGLAIAVHIGPWCETQAGWNAASALAQVRLLEKEQIDPSAWIWMHAQNEGDAAQRVAVARRGGWVSLDGFRAGEEARYVRMVAELREAGVLDRVLVSQDAGWYTAGEPRGGEFVPFDALFTALVPALRSHGLREEEIETLLIGNPARAFSLRKVAA